MTTTQHPCFPAAGRPIELLGLKGPYILVVAAVFLGDLILFVILYCAGFALVGCIGLALALAAAGCYTSATLSKRFGPNGLAKRLAGRSFPKGLRLDSRQAFLHLQKK